MSDPFIGQINMLPFPWAPQGYHLCDGTSLQISQNNALFSLLGIQFGGDGRTNFLLPDLRGRTPLGQGVSPDDGTLYRQGKIYGQEGVTLAPTNVPSHTHSVTANPTNGTQMFVGGNNFATTTNQTAGSTIPFDIYLPNTAGAAVPNAQVLAAQSVSVAGGNTPHNNMQPFTVLNFSIALLGYYPSRP